MSNKKQKNSSAKKSMRNVLAQPYEFIWPILKDTDDINELNDILKELLPKKKTDRKLSWTQLRKLSKEERKELKNKTGDELDVNADKIIVGVNAVTRAVEKKNISCILLEADVDPMMMIKHIVVMGQNNDIPVVLMPGLKKTTLEKIGFAGLVLGLKKSETEENSHFYNLYEKISNLSKSFPKPKDPEELFQEDLLDQNQPDSVIQDLSSEPNDSNHKKISKPFVLSSSVYKYRGSVSERVFIPPEFKVEAEDFISLADISDLKDSKLQVSGNRYMDIDQNKIKETNQEEEEEEKEEEPMDQEEIKPINKLNKKLELSIYQPLKVKQIQKNPKRLKATKIPKSKTKVPIKKKNK
ncbi:ribonuclease P protein subunit p38-like [Microplitis mediator]|uniref:ribonuclease P protein subunit p38-like n=1 Tax=Microplitis mediator TaxID=375433 RepID=UPI002553CF80|nr:ribonuclease P protein subunit p38-like [Microplitis mediator]